MSKEYRIQPLGEYSYLWGRSITNITTTLMITKEQAQQIGNELKIDVYNLKLVPMTEEDKERKKKSGEVV